VTHARCDVTTYIPVLLLVFIYLYTCILLVVSIGTFLYSFHLPNSVSLARSFRQLHHLKYNTSHWSSDTWLVIQHTTSITYNHRHRNNLLHYHCITRQTKASLDLWTGGLTLIAIGALSEWIAYNVMKNRNHYRYDMSGMTYVIAGMPCQVWRVTVKHMWLQVWHWHTSSNAIRIQSLRQIRNMFEPFQGTYKQLISNHS